MPKLFFFILFFNLILSTSSYSQINLNNGLIAYYPFSGNANDQSGNNLHGVIKNGLQPTSDRFGNPGKAFYFNGIDSYVEVPDNPLLRFTNTFSISLLFSRDPSSLTAELIEKRNWNDGGNSSFDFGLVNNGRVRTAVKTGNNCSDPINGWVYPTLSNITQPDTWYCIVATFNNGDMKFYLDGILIGSSQTPQTQIDNCSGSDMRIGIHLNFDKLPFKGKIDEVRLYNREINVSEIKALCSNNPVENTIGKIINSYSPILSFEPCENALQLEDATEYTVGDTVLLMQMKGAIIDSSNSAAFGTVTNYSNSGNYEYNYIAAKDVNKVVLKNKLTREYDFPYGKVQLIRVPYYKKTATITTELTALTWDGKKGGVLAFLVEDSLVLQSNLNVSGKGFQGGRSVNTSQLVRQCDLNDYFYPLQNKWAASKGESFTTVTDNIISGKGHLASAGGGGLDHNSGGGGGGNAGKGGFGGYQLDNCENGRGDNRGIGGSNIPYTNTENKIFLGGGGGSGHSNQPNGIDMNGGDGGGIIIISAKVLVSNGYSIISSGNDAVQCNLNPLDWCHDGNGGGGAGGTLILDVNKFDDQPDIISTGGKGADLIVYFSAAGRVGPGGGGGGGLVWTKTNNLSASSITLDGGKNGVIKPDNNNPYGATEGEPGMFLTTLPQLPVDSILFTNNIDSVNFKDSITFCKTVQLDAFAITNQKPITIFNWTLGDGSSLSSQNVLHSYLSGGTYEIKLIATDEDGCKDSMARTVILDTIKAIVNADTLVCENIPVILKGEGGSRYEWSPANLLNDRNSQTPIATVLSTTRFFLKIENEIGCADTASTLITIRQPPLFVKPSDTTICEGSSVQLTSDNNPEYSYTWSPATALSDADSPAPIANPMVTTNYSLLISDPYCNYDSSFQVNVIVNPLPNVSAEKSNDINCQQPTAQLTASGASAYTWLPATNLDDSISSNPVTDTDTSTTFRVRGTNQYGCSDEATVTVKVTKDGKVLDAIPNAFSPNGDRKNDCFGINHWGNVQLLEFSVFNRWGQIVFSTRNPQLCWDGTFNGKELDSGAYVYIIKARSFCGDVVRKGIVTLVR